ncbi:glycoside hydrolase family protein [Pedobacter cryophilus]|uniref:Glycoside hydrolase family 5 domain-containing protein n=1 Tax=Pedobacter cryophilus TaxID=2571271 RepID=A0A4U1BVR2_9SPHI|nr:hypothetical protein [Pedobacter cryophilus]TKB96919.1 hypothetical protein FA046_12650 [Pedobacter cryophilus]
MFKFIITTLILAISVCSLSAQIKISPYLMGQNAWGRGDIFRVQKEVEQVKYQTIRIGGNGYENSGFITNQAIKYIDYARSVGAEPFLQMPRQLRNDNKAYEAVKYLNGEKGKNIKFWSIGNEPDHRNQLSSPEDVYDYFTKISTQIKKYDPKAKVMGFDLASYTLKYMDRFLGGDLDLTGKIPGTDVYYLDGVTFHNYKFLDISRFEADVKLLKTKLAKFNAARPKENQLTWSITEFNTHWIVDPKLEERYQPYTFHNGQIFAEMYDLGMREGAFTICPWSILEGGADREGTDLSMFDLVNGKYEKRSNYYHTQMLAQNIKKQYLSHQDNSKDLVIIPMGDKSGIAIMILNKSKTQPINYTLQLNHKKLKVDDVLINVNAKTNKKVTDSISASCTQMLVFNSKGNLIKKYTYSSKNADAKSEPVLVLYKGN